MKPDTITANQIKWNNEETKQKAGSGLGMGWSNKNANSLKQVSDNQAKLLSVNVNKQWHAF